MNDSKALAVIPKTLDEVNSLSELLSKSALLPDGLKGKVPDIAVSILAGAELGLAPMAAIRGVHVVQGRPVLSADTMVALIMGSGLAEYFICVEETAERVTYETKRKGSPAPQRATWSREDTKRAGLNTKDNWRLYERQMMKARAKAILGRDAYPDVLAGCYEPDELQIEATRPAPAIEVEDAEIVTDADLAERINTTRSPDELRALVPELTKLKGETRKTLKARYDQRMAYLTETVTNGVNHEAAQ